MRHLSQLTVLLLLMAGCSYTASNNKVTEPRTVDCLREVGELLSLHAGQFQRGPTKASDLARYEQGYPLGYQAVASGDIIVVWGAIMPGEGEQTGSDVIVAYERETPTNGGFVLLQNRHICRLTAAEFASARKFGKP